MTHIEDVEERPAKRLKISPEPGLSHADASEQAITQGSEVSDDLVAEKERKVGITSFVNESKPVIRGWLKTRYSDFLVNEVLPGGKVLHLQQTKVGKNIVQVTEKNDYEEKFGLNGTANQAPSSDPEPPTSTATPKESQHVVNGSTSAHQEASLSIPEVSGEDRAKLVSSLNEKAVVELLALYKSICKNPKGKSRDHPTVKTEFTSDRTLRAHIHQDIRRIFSSKIDSSTNQEGILVLSAAPQRQENRPSRTQSRRPNWQERGGDYCHFTLYKENKDTMEAVSLLARLMRMGSKEFSFAGTKDRRGVTVQRVSARRVDAERLAGLNKTLRMVVLGDFDYSPHEVGLGDLEGNEFSITLRNCTLSSESSELSHEETLTQIKTNLTTALSSLATHGFINYFGLQRFGTFAIRSDIVGLKLLLSDFEGACNAILDYPAEILLPNTQNQRQPQHETQSQQEPQSQVGREDLARAEAIRLFRTNPTNKIKDALQLMPHRFSAESALIRHLSRHPTDHLGAILSIPHSLRTMYLHAYQSMVWNAAASHRWSLYGNQVVVGDLVLVREHKSKESATIGTDDGGEVDQDGEVIIQPSGPSNSSKTVNEAFERARPLSQAEAESGRFSIFDVVLPQPGFDVLYPDNESGAFYKTFMASEAGSGVGLDPHDMKRKQKDFSLPGAYRKIVGRINGDGWGCEVREYADHNVDGHIEQFVETDWERIKNSQTSDRGERSAGHVEVENGKDVSGERDGEKEKKETTKKVAAILKFQLGTSQYATMALRELSGGGIREYKPEFSGGR